VTDDTKLALTLYHSLIRWNHEYSARPRLLSTNIPWMRILSLYKTIEY
jgi:hypothetical protein